MLMSLLFGTTLREAPADVSSAGHALLARAGFLREHGPGRLSWLPLGHRALTRTLGLLRRELAACGGMELAMPAAADAAPAVRSVAAQMPWSTVAALCRKEVRSWRQLPRLLFHAADAATIDAFMLASDDVGLDGQCRSMQAAVRRVLHSCGVPVVELGGPGGARSFARLSAGGDLEIARCEACGSAAPRDTARFSRPAPRAEEPLPLEKVATPGCTTIDDLCSLLRLPRIRTAKAVFQVADDKRFIFAVVRGDRDLSEAKLRDAVGAEKLRPATAEEISAAGAVPGYASPIGLPVSTLVVVDEELPLSPNLAAGANQEGFHVLNTNIPRDYRPSMVADIAMVPADAACAQCSGPLEILRGVELACIVRGGAKLSESMDAVYQGTDGREMPVLIAHMRFHAGRLIVCAAEEHHDERGLRWPAAIAPFDVHLVSLGGPGTEAMLEAQRLSEEMAGAGLEVLFDDTVESPGVKFADADLIGIPLRLTVSTRSLKAGGAELKRRDAEEKLVVPSARVAARVKEMVQGDCASLA